jgi:tetratricopeptide (TPR) repeat protein
MNQLRRFARTAGLLAVLALNSSLCFAQDPNAKKEAAALSAEGAAKFDENDFMGALDAFSRAYALYKAPTIGVYVARCQHALGRHAAALATYDDVLALPVASDAPKQVRTALDEARGERQDMLQRVSWLEIQVSGATTFKILIDGVEAKPQSGNKFVLDTGPHQVVARADGFADASQRVDAVATQTQAISLTLAPSSAAPVVAPVPGAAPGGEPVFQGPTFAQDKYAEEENRRRAEQEAEQKRQAEALRKAQEAERKRQEAERVERERKDRESAELAALRRPYIIPGYVAAGVGMVALGISYASYSSASSSKDSLDEQCVNQRCPKAASSDLDSAKSSANLATYTLIGGTVVTGVGVALLVKGYTMSLPTREGAWNLSVSPSGVSVLHSY